MKKFIYFIFLFLLAPVVFADDTISMVTYFPTPYMAYRDLDVSKSGAVGLIDRCTINCGTLTADTVNVTRGKLTLGGPNPVNVTNQFAFGSVGAGSAGTLKFEDNLEITNINNTALENIKVTGKATLSGLQLGAYDFPQCDTSTHKISYKELTLDGTKGTFLVCGEGEGPACSDGYHLARQVSSQETLDMADNRDDRWEEDCDHFPVTYNCTNFCSASSDKGKTCTDYEVEYGHDQSGAEWCYSVKRVYSCSCKKDASSGGSGGGTSTGTWTYTGITAGSYCYGDESPTQCIGSCSPLGSTCDDTYCDGSRMDTHHYTCK